MTRQTLHLILALTVLAASASLVMSLGEEPSAGKDDKARPAVSLEFRMVANAVDDAEALAAGTKYFQDAQQNPQRKNELEKLSRQGLPPASPKPPVAKGFKTPLGTYTYTWVEIAPKSLRTWSLGSEHEKNPRLNAVWKQAATARAKAEPLLHPYDQSLLYSRECRNSRLAEPERQKKRFDYFLLTRDPEPGKSLTGASLERVTAGTDVHGAPAIHLQLNKKGSDLLFELTSKNQPRGPDDEGQFIRALAIVLDGRIVMAPKLGHRTLREEAIIDGLFTEAEVKRIVEDLRRGLAKSSK